MDKDPIKDPVGFKVNLQVFDVFFGFLGHWTLTRLDWANYINLTTHARNLPPYNFPNDSKFTIPQVFVRTQQKTPPNADRNHVWVHQDAELAFSLQP